MSGLVESATRDLAMLRDGQVDDSGALLEDVRTKLQSTMEVEPEAAASINALALWQLEVARRAGGVPVTPMLATYQMNAPRASQQGLELAERVLALGLARFPDEAELHNTSGLVDVELHAYGNALYHFDRARQLSPGFEAAHFNYAALAFELRDYAAAERGYREVLRITPGRYEAQLGLALAMELALEPGSSASRQLAVFEILREVKRLDPARPEVYFNAALFTLDILARRRADPSRAIQYAVDALCLFDQFLTRADPIRHAEAIHIAKIRSVDVMDAAKFITESSRQPRDCTRSVL